MSKLHLALACMTYDRTRAMIDGAVKPRGIDLNYLAMENPTDIFVRMLKHSEFQASELSLSSYYTATSTLNPPFIAIPVFPSRLFRHSYIFVNADSGIKEPRDLIGKKVGTPRYHMTAPIWIRGILQHEYDIPLEKIRWFTERPEKIASSKMKVKLEMIPQSATLDQLLESGELDAVTEAHLPPSYLRGSSKVKRLFTDYKAVEMEYYKRTRIFPIMHTVVIRRDVYDAHPWVAVSLHEAFVEAKKACYAARLDPVQGKESNPWALAALEEEKSLLGNDPYPHSIEENRHVLQALMQYMLEQGLVDKETPLEAMFAPNTLNLKG